MTSGRGVDTAIEAVGVPATFVLCEDIVAPGGTIANVARGPGGSASRTPVENGVAINSTGGPRIATRYSRNQREYSSYR